MGSKPVSEMHRNIDPPLRPCQREDMHLTSARERRKSVDISHRREREREREREDETWRMKRERE